MVLVLKLSVKVRTDILFPVYHPVQCLAFVYISIKFIP